MRILNGILLLTGPPKFRRHGNGFPVLPIIALAALAAWALFIGLAWLGWWAL